MGAGARGRKTVGDRVRLRFRPLQQASGKVLEKKEDIHLDRGRLPGSMRLFRRPTIPLMGS
jgi:hypothetical protein